jgi:hypothetical protein
MTLPVDPLRREGDRVKREKERDTKRKRQRDRETKGEREREIERASPFQVIDAQSGLKLRTPAPNPKP